MSQHNDNDDRDSNLNESLSQDSEQEDRSRNDKGDVIGHRHVDDNGKVIIIPRNKKKTKKKNTKKKKKHNGSEQKDSEYFPNKNMHNQNNVNNRNNSNSNLNESHSQDSEREDRSSNNKKKKKSTSQRSSLSYANWRLPSELSIDKQGFVNEDYAGQNEAIECDYENKTITITVEGTKYVFDGESDEITIWHKGNNKKKDTIKDITTIDCKISKISPINSKIHKSNAKISFTNKKKEIPTTYTIPIKTEKLIEHLYSFEKTKKEQGIFKPGVVNRFVDHYLKNYSKLSDARLLPSWLEIKCTSGKEEIKYAKFVYYMDVEKIRYFTDNDNIGKEIYNNKVVAKIAEKRVKFEIIDDNGRRILYKLPISDDFIELLKQTDKDFAEKSSKYIEIDFNALCDVVEMNDAPFADVNDVDLTIEEVERITDGYYKFTTNNENTYIRYSATDKTFEYMKNGKCVKTYDILSYRNAEDKNQDHHLYLSTRGNKKKQLCFSIRNEEMKSFFNKLCGESTESQRLIKGKDLTNALKDKCEEKKPNFFSNLVDGLKKPKGIKYITGKEITIANEGENLIFSLDENGENKITIPIQDFLFGNLAAFTCKRKKEDPHITYYDDALVLEHKTDDPNSRSTIIIDFKQMLQEQGLDTKQYPDLDDMKSFLIRIKAAEKKQQARKRSQQPDDNDYFFEVENDIISTIYNNGENIEKAAAYMHLNDYINEYADQEMTEDEINFFIDIFGSLNNINGLAYKIEAQIQENIREDKNVDFNKIFIALMCIAEPEQVQAFTNVFIEKYKNPQNIQQEVDNWPEINALIAYGFITNDQNQEFNQSVTDYTNQAHQSNTNDIQNNALEIPSIISDIVSCEKRRKINNAPIKKQNLNIVQKFGKKISKGIKSIFSHR